MNNANRRGFLKIAGAGAAAAGAVSLAPSTVAMAGSPTAAVVATTPAHALPSAAAGSMAAYIDDVSTGEIVVMVEGREVVVTDHDLVARLATAVHSAATASV